VSTLRAPSLLALESRFTHIAGPDDNDICWCTQHRQFPAKGPWSSTSSWWSAKISLRTPPLREIALKSASCYLIADGSEPRAAGSGKPMSLESLRALPHRGAF
jgi:hypothetical protein